MLSKLADVFLGYSKVSKLLSEPADVFLGYYSNVSKLLLEPANVEYLPFLGYYEFLLLPEFFVNASLPDSVVVDDVLLQPFFDPYF